MRDSARKSCGAKRVYFFATQGLSFAPCLNKGAKLWSQLIAPKATFSSIHKSDEKVGLDTCLREADR
ncbi:MAG: hypothetical protein A3G33_10405 [Omnitrophica bacterium RIFCSPLOWO2_12_FULL_44_17]|uniref:Uncharacterized protein n=1 Tax=Candidatus Danuiimicrobium aquiferis TaxID=1801832 RepID=A0A1G1KR40_9BACT|nr:MAG: hypothetical protein A3B72_02720 [Omnitrophica bacterium RIFCSPHIGHO2_02_FULL_45_28]OGW95387.1 MAG: hypothetical protein A3G33_10405 [Omnitrophica bacterium RIFCSPLOWO2_12_FULL_44_17]OGX03273.1 MAG: hypothetical protein A3J12_07040 [Omnitrophica bacterium RIFCSPLOWO2_02_FULL_44_11]